MIIISVNHFKNISHEYSRSGVSMNTIINISINSDSRKPLDDAFILLESLDKYLSLYNPNSELNKINNNAGIKPVTTNKYVYEIINESKNIYNLTEGAFNPLIGPITKLWKINNNDKNYKIPSKLSLDIALKLTDINNLNLIVNPDSIFLKTSGATLDMGGIAKGYASLKIAELFNNNGVKNSLINLGGNIYVTGEKFWRIGIRDPLNNSNPPAVIINAKNTSVITSGNYERFKIIDGVKYSHFFNPLDGMPVKNNLLSVTVITPNATKADALATAFMITGIEKAKKLPPEDFGVIFIYEAEGSKSPEILTSNNLKNLIVKANYPINFF